MSYLGRVQVLKEGAMERAGSIHTGHIWNAVDFQHADDDVRALHRSQGNGFRCVDCGGEACEPPPSFGPDVL